MELVLTRLSRRNETKVSIGVWPIASLSLMNGSSVPSNGWCAYKHQIRWRLSIFFSLSVSYTSSRDDRRHSSCFLSLVITFSILSIAERSRWFVHWRPTYMANAVFSCCVSAHLLDVRVWCKKRKQTRERERIRRAGRRETVVDAWQQSGV